MRRNLWISLILICVVSFGGLAIIFVTNNHPALGLDLRGGISVTLEPKPGTEYDSAGLDLAVEQIRYRVDSLGVAEPEILRQGDAIVVNLPGVKDQDTALRLVQVTGKVNLRPVLQCTAPTGSTTTVAGATTTTAVGASAPTGSSPSTGGVVDSAPAAANGLLPAQCVPVDLGRRRPRPRRRAPRPPPTPAPPPRSPGRACRGTARPPRARSPCPTRRRARSCPPATARSATSARRVAPARCSSATPRPRSSPAPGGVSRSTCAAAPTARTCGTQLAAAVLQPVADVPERPAGDRARRHDHLPPDDVNSRRSPAGVQISGSFSEGEAKNLARVLRSGALPVQLQTQTVQNVSPTLGKDSLQGGHRLRARSASCSCCCSWSSTTASSGSS